MPLGACRRRFYLILHLDPLCVAIHSGVHCSQRPNLLFAHCFPSPHQPHSSLAPSTGITASSYCRSIISQYCPLLLIFIILLFTSITIFAWMNSCDPCCYIVPLPSSGNARSNDTCHLIVLRQNSVSWHDDGWWYKHS